MSSLQSKLYDWKNLFSTFTPRLEEEFQSQYYEWNDADKRRFYLQLFGKIKAAVVLDNDAYLYNLGSIIDCINAKGDDSTLHECYQTDGNPIKIVNLVILATRRGKLKSLQFMFSKGKETIFNLSRNCGMKAISPGDVDNMNHTAFYYAMQKKDTELLSTLIDRWPDDHFLKNSEELDEHLSKAYKELKLRNVYLSNEMDVYVISKLVDLRFFETSTSQSSDDMKKMDDIIKRMELLLDAFDLMIKELPNYEELDEELLIVGEFIAKNLCTLKYQLKSICDRVPWEEMAFCLIIFVKKYTKPLDTNLFYSSILNKNIMVTHLRNFSEALRSVKDSIRKDSIKSLTQYPNMQREDVTSQIQQEFPQFKQFYSDYEQVRDFYSLELIKSYADLATSADSTKCGQIVIARSLQVIGECSKNSWETPKLSNDTRKQFLLVFLQDICGVLKKLRNTLSKEESLSLRELIADYNESFFLNIRTDLSKISAVITEILIGRKSKAIRSLFKKILEFKTVDSLKDHLGVFNFSQPILEQREIVKNQTKKIILNPINQLAKSISDFRNIVGKTPRNVKENFEEIMAVIRNWRSEMETFLNTFYFDFMRLEMFVLTIENNQCTNDKNLNYLQEGISKSLKNENREVSIEKLLVIAGCLKHIFWDVMPSLTPTILNKINQIWDESVYDICFGVGNTKWITELKSTLSIQIEGQDKSHNKKLMSSKLGSLRKVFQEHELFETAVPYQKDFKLRAEVDMLVFDIMSILSKSHFSHNPFFLDGVYPIAIGKNMRNHLAHENILCNVFLPDDHLQILINARKILQNITDINVPHIIDKVVQCDISLLENTHHLNLNVVRIQKELYNAIKRGCLNDVKALRKKGADIKGRNLKLWTTLHFAASNSDVEVLKYLCANNVNENARDINGRSPLHIAAAFGRSSAVEYLLKELNMPVDDADSNGKTPLHFASENGHGNVIEILLKHKASTTLKDKLGPLAPIHYAFLNNHIETSGILLNEKGVNEIRACRGETLLHYAAENGSLELVEMLLAKNFELEVRNDRSHVPLHLAANSGHSIVVQALLRGGANVNAKTINNKTPLDFALGNCHLDTATILLSCGADVNSNISLNTTCLQDLEYRRITDFLLNRKICVQPFQTSRRSALHFAATGGSVQSVKLLLQHKASIDAVDGNKFTALHLAAVSGHKDIVQLLIDEGASVNCRNASESTPLHMAAISGHLEVVQVLIDNGAYLNTMNDSGNTALHLSVEYKHEMILKFMMRKGADVWGKNVAGKTALQIAITRNMTECFISEGINMSLVVYEDGRTALHEGVASGNVEFVKYCIQSNCDVNARDKNGATALHLAAVRNEEEIMKMLINNGSQLEIKENEGHTALDIAVFTGHKGAVKYLIEKKAGIRYMSLYLAVIRDHSHIVEMLITTKKIDVNFKYNSYFNLLHVAVKNGNRRISEILLKEGAKPDVQTPQELYTPLHYAAHGGHRDVAILLLSHNADPNVTSNEGDTPLHLAIRKGNTNVISVLLEHAADAPVRPTYLKSAFVLAVSLDKLQALEVLLSKTDADINHRSEYTRTLLHIASQKGHFEILKYLITSFADVNATNSDGLQPIHLASLNGHTNIVEYLLDHGSNIGDLGANQRTLLHYAAEGGHSSTLESVIQKGVCTNCVDASGETPLHVAAKNGHASALRTLLEHGSYYDVRDNNCKTPLEEATSPETVAILKSIERLFEAVKEGDASGVERLIKGGALPNAKCDENMTPLMYASWKGFSNVVDALLSGGADPNISGKHGFVALHYASQLPNGSCIVKSLLSKSAVYDYLSEEGKTPLDISDSRNDLLKTVDQMFDYVRKGRNCESDVLNCLNELTNVDELRAVVRARNREGKTLVAVAMCNDFSKMENMKYILLKDLLIQFEKGKELLSQGKKEESAFILNVTLIKSTDILCSENPFVLDIREKFALSKMRECNWNDALSMLKEIDQVREKTLGVDHMYTVNTKFWVSVCLKHEGRVKEALDMLEDVYRKQKAIFREIEASGKLASVSTKILDCFVETEAHLEMIRSEVNPCEDTLCSLQKVYEKTHKAFEAGHDLNLGIQHRIANLYSTLGKHEEALVLYQNVYNMSKQEFGKNFSLTLKTLRDIAGEMCFQRKWDEALHVFEKMFRAQKETLGPSHHDTLSTQYNIGLVFFHEREYLGSLLIFREGLAQRKEILGYDHTDIVDTLKKIDFIESVFKYENSWILQQIYNLFHDEHTN